jgi:hypothetical protein
MFMAKNLCAFPDRQSARKQIANGAWHDNVNAEPQPQSPLSSPAKSG